MSEKSEKMVLKVPAIHEEYEVKPITELFDDEDTKRRWITGKKLVDQHPELVSETAERDSRLAQEQGIPERTTWVLFIGKDRIWCVARDVGRLDRYACSLDFDFRDHYRVARPSM